MTNNIINHLSIWSTAQTLKTSNRGRGASNQSLFGINKLRELILELAVRGKLVPQNPEDEPASVLLKKIDVEKKRLIKEGKIKKQEALPEIGEDEKPVELPNNWIWTKLGIISFINPRNDAKDDTLASFVPMPLITTSYTGNHGQEERQWKEIKQGYTHFANGDIGVAKITPCFENSKAVVFSDLINGVGAGTTELHIARPYGDTLNARYVLLYLKAPQFLHLGETKMTGTAGQKRVPKDFFAENPFPLPPLPEQHRIVAKVDELMALCDRLEQQQSDSNSAHEMLVEILLDTLTDATDQSDFESAWHRIANHFDTLFTTEHSIDRLKQTILQLAVMGKLVPQNPEDEPASELLKKIYKEKKHLIENRVIRKDKLIFDEEDINIYSLPENWKPVYMQDITSVITCGIASTPKYFKEGKIFLSAKNVKPFRFIPDEHQFVDEETYRKIISGGAKPEKGDILVTRVGAGIGQAAIIDQDIDFAYYVSLTLIKPLQSSINSKFLLIWINSPEGVNKAIENIYGRGVSQGNLNVNQVRKFVIPLPPLPEQYRIVSKVDELFAICDGLKGRINEAQVTQLNLAKALVEGAVG